MPGDQSRACLTPMSGSIKAVEMVHRIRDAHYEQLRGKSPEERIVFYRAKSGLLQAEIALLARGDEETTPT